MSDAQPGPDLAALRAYLEDQGVAVTAALTARLLTGGRSNLTFRVTDGASQWVVRRPPYGEIIESAHDVGREYRIMAALQDTDVPVPPTILYCADSDVIGAPFTVVEFVTGTTLRTQHELDDIPDDSVARIHHELIRVLARLHDVPYAEHGLDGFGRPGGFFERQVKRWRRQWDATATRELPDVDRLHAALLLRAPRREEVTVVHGDYRVDNTLLDLDNGSVRAVVDWEMSTIGDPLTDVAMMCVYQHPAFDHIVGEPASSTSSRWPGVESIVEDYASASGRDVTGFSAYLALAYFKLAVIAEGIASRHQAGNATEPGYETAAQSVPLLLAAGLEVAGS